MNFKLPFGSGVLNRGYSRSVNRKFEGKKLGTFRKKDPPLVPRFYWGLAPVAYLKII